MTFQSDTSIIRWKLHLKSSPQIVYEKLATDEGLPEEDRTEVTAGWVSVLMSLKASVDFGIDLRNHDPQRTWDEVYVEN
jgi:hypothetical protein